MTNKADVLLGLQWGDEGKGKAVDVIAPQYDVVARFQGGPNAGHTLEIGDIKIVLNTIPSGVFREKAINLIGNGVVINPIVIQDELKRLETAGLNIDNSLYISKRAHLILPTHPMIDAALEKAKGDKKIGSTLRGIGPAYRDKIVRAGIRVGDLLEDDFKGKVRSAIDVHCAQLKALDYDLPGEEMIQEWLTAADKLRKFHIVDAEHLLQKEMEKGSKILAEGAQGTLLDIDFGSYPYVTSSNTICAGACTGLGLAPSKIGDVYGIFKAYCTRVGSGPFPTELFDEVGLDIAKRGNEFGATTGRPRRCGWLDLPALKYAVNINGVNKLIMTKSDVLSDMDEVRVCTAYLKDGVEIFDLPYNLEGLEPVYKSFKAWGSEIENASRKEDFPQAFLDYVAYLEEELSVKMTIISVGPKRSQTIFC